MQHTVPEDVQQFADALSQLTVEQRQRFYRDSHMLLVRAGGDGNTAAAVALAGTAVAALLDLADELPLGGLVARCRFLAVDLKREFGL